MKRFETVLIGTMGCVEALKIMFSDVTSTKNIPEIY